MTSYGLSLGGKSTAHQRAKYGCPVPVFRLFVEGDLPLDNPTVQDPQQVACLTWKGSAGVGPAMVNGAYDNNLRAFLRGLPAKRIYLGYYHEPGSGDAWTPPTWSAAQEHFLTVVRDTSGVVADVVTVCVFIAGDFRSDAKDAQMRAWMPTTILPDLIGFDFDGNYQQIYPDYDEVHLRTKRFADSYNAGICAPEFAHLALNADPSHAGRTAWIHSQVGKFEADDFVFVCYWDSHDSTLTTSNEISAWAGYMSGSEPPVLPPPAPPSTGGAINATAVPEAGRVDLTVTWDQSYPPTVARHDPDGPWRWVRSATPVALAGGVWTGSDHLAPLDTPFRYVAQDTSGKTRYSPEVTVDSLGVAWLKHPGRPTLDVQLGLTELPDLDRAAVQGLFPVLGRQKPVAITMPGLSGTGVLRFSTATEPERLAVLALLATGSVLQLAVPADVGLESPYIAAGKLSEKRVAGRAADPVRLWELPFQVVDGPV